MSMETLLLLLLLLCSAPPDHFCENREQSERESQTKTQILSALFYEKGGFGFGLSETLDMHKDKKVSKAKDSVVNSPEIGGKAAKRQISIYSGFCKTR